MKISELKKEDILEYSYSNSVYRNEDNELIIETKIKRDMVMFVTKDGNTCAFGGMFSYDFRDLKFLKVWREAESGNYEVIYDEKTVINK